MSTLFLLKNNGWYLLKKVVPLTLNIRIQFISLNLFLTAQKNTKPVNRFT